MYANSRAIFPFASTGSSKRPGGGHTYSREDAARFWTRQATVDRDMTLESALKSDTAGKDRSSDSSVELKTLRETL